MQAVPAEVLQEQLEQLQQQHDQLRTEAQLSMQAKEDLLQQLRQENQQLASSQANVVSWPHHFTDINCEIAALLTEQHSTNQHQAVPCCCSPRAKQCFKPTALQAGIHRPADKRASCQTHAALLQLLYQMSAALFCQAVGMRTHFME